MIENIRIHANDTIRIRQIISGSQSLSMVENTKPIAPSAITVIELRIIFFKQFICVIPSLFQCLQDLFFNTSLTDQQIVKTGLLLSDPVDPFLGLFKLFTG
jgi:hypothetical protein